MTMTYAEALSTLQEPHRSQALENLKNSTPDDIETGKISDFLLGAFIFSDTPQGHDYWDKKLRELQKLGL